MNFYYVFLCYPPLFETLFAMVLVFKTQFGLVGDRAQFQQKHGDGVMEKNNVLTGLCLQCRQSKPVHDNVSEPSMCDVVRHSLLTLGISERSLLEVAPRPFASLIVQLGHRVRLGCPNLCHRFWGGLKAASDDQLELLGEAWWSDWAISKISISQLPGEQCHPHCLGV